MSHLKKDQSFLKRGVRGENTFVHKSLSPRVSINKTGVFS